ncbi:MAG: TonB-dependent receptor [Gammaproteobacteria bacterium]|nr:TonB-dependent receptor [Gammaproteobacteria bacterium]
MQKMNSVKKPLAALAAVVILCSVHWHPAHGGGLAPAPQVITVYDRDFIERSGAQTYGEMLDTGILRYFFTGGRDLVILVNGRPWSTTGSDLDSLPLSAVERIEVLRAEGLGTLGGHAAVLGGFNLVLRQDLEGFDVRTVARMPDRAGGEARQAGAVWGGAVGDGGHLTFGVDFLDRGEIVGSAREHSRSEWTDGGSFAEARNVSVGGNTVYVLDASADELRAVPLGGCERAHGYTGPLANPPGIDSGDRGCGFAYGDFWWDSASHDRKSAIVNLDHPLGERAELRMDANVTQGRSAFRYAPSVDVFSILPGSDLLDAINGEARGADPAFEVAEEDVFSVGHRFIGHGNRDWRTDTEEYDLSGTVTGRLTETLGYDARISASGSDGQVSGVTFVDAEIIREEIGAGRYDLADPLSMDPVHREAIRRSSLREEEDFGSRYLVARLALEGAGARGMAWTAGAEFADVEAHRLLAFRAADGGTRDVGGVLGSGGASYRGERETAGAFAEASLPLSDTVAVRAAARADEYSDVGGVHAGRLGVEYRPNGIVTLRGSWSMGDQAPSMHHLHSTASQDHPHVRCVPEAGPPPRRCDPGNYRQVTRSTTGNPDLDPSGSERGSVGVEIRRGPSYFMTDWYRLTTSDLPGLHDADWAMLNHPGCGSGSTGGCIERAAGDITIHERFANIVETGVSGVNMRFGTRADADRGFVAMRGFWRHVTSSEERIAGEEGRYPLPRNAVRIVTSVGRGDLTAFWAVNWRDEIPDRLGDGRFGSWTGHDLTLDWRRPLGFDGARITTGVYNVTDAKLSTNTAHPSRTDGPRAAGWGRTFFVTLNMRF